MKTLRHFIATSLALLASSSWAAQFVDPMTYHPSQKDQLIEFAHEMALKNYGIDKEPVVEYMTNKLVNACIWLSKNADDKALLKQVIEEWRPSDGDYLMMKFDYIEKSRVPKEDDVLKRIEMFQDRIDRSY